MRALRVITFVCLMVLGLARNAPAQTDFRGNITTSSADCSIGAACVEAVLQPGDGALSVTVAGTYSGTLQFEVSTPPNVSGTRTWVAITGDPLPSGSRESSTTSTGTWAFNVGGFERFRVRASALVSGTANIAGRGSTASAKTRSIENLSVATLNNVRYCDQFSGANAGAKIAACIADLPSTGGTADARGLEGAQTVAQDIFSGVTKPVILLIGAASYSSSAGWTVGADNIQIIGMGASSATAGTVLTFSNTGVAITVNKSGGNAQHVQLSSFRIVLSASSTKAIEATSPFRHRYEQLTIAGTDTAGQIGIEIKDDETQGSAIYNELNQVNIADVDVGVRLNKTSTTKAVSLNELNQVTGTVNVKGVDFIGATHNTISDSNFALTANNAIGIDIDANTQLTRIIGGLYEISASQTGTIGIRTATGSSGTLVLGTSVSNTATPVSNGSTSGDNVFILGTTGLSPMRSRFERLDVGPIGGAAFIVGNANSLNVQAGGAFAFNGKLLASDGTSAAEWSTTAFSLVKSANFRRLRGINGTALVAGDFALSAGWGTTASVGSLRGVDSYQEFTITSAGTGQGASPTITLTYKDGTWTTAPIVICNRQEYANQPTITLTVTTQSATTYVLTFNGTPVAAETYRIACHVGGI